MQKRNILLLGIALVLAIIIAVLVIPRLDSPKETDVKTSEETEQVADYVPPLEFSLLPEFSFSNLADQPYGSGELKNTVWLANFIFEGEDDSDYSILDGMHEMANDLQSFVTWNDISLVSLGTSEAFSSLDLSKYQEKSSTPWVFLKGTQDEIISLGNEGFKFGIKKEGTSIIHPHKIALIDRNMILRGYYDPTNPEEVKYLMEDIRYVLRKHPHKIAVPEDVINPGWLDERQADQISALKNSGVFHDFSFEDRLEESNITWRHQIVDDSGINYKACHYDHGNGVVVADVNGDNLLDIFFLTQLGSNQLWQNTGDGKFENITDLSPDLEIRDAVSVAASFADIDNDGDPDLFVTTVLEGNRLFENNGDGTFKDITAASGLGYKGHSSGTSFFDFNNDGLLDLFVSNVGIYTTGKIVDQITDHPDNPLQNGTFKFHEAFSDAFAGHIKPERTEQSILYRNEGGNRFTDVSEEMKLVDKSWTGDTSPCDLNKDGWMDLYVTNMQGDDHYYENQKGEYFTEKTKEIFPNTPWGAMGIAIFDFENDQNMDIFLTDMHSDMGNTYDLHEEKMKKTADYSEALLANSSPHFGNAFFKNSGNGTFTEISDVIGAENLWPWGLSSGDLNGDGYEDAFLASSMNYPYRYGANSLLLNEGGQKFLDSEFVVGVEPRKNKETASWWYNQDTLVTVGDSQVKREVWGALGSRSSVIFDIENDGDLDIVTSEFNNPPLVLVSNLSEQKTDLNYLKISLEGTASNKDGLGAIIKIKAGNDYFTKMYNGKSGYLSQSLYPVYFGLGDHKEVEFIEIKWPSGKTQTIRENISINSEMKIVEE
ncbi:MAG: CRTAC1 family protein [Bacteroidetes bacterium]|nr:MAG: CRTAC1 family protein [Bacteroidota bacterium]